MDHPRTVVHPTYSVHRCYDKRGVVTISCPRPVARFDVTTHTMTRSFAEHQLGSRRPAGERAPCTFDSEWPDIERTAARRRTRLAQWCGRRRVTYAGLVKPPWSPLCQTNRIAHEYLKEYPTARLTGTQTYSLNLFNFHMKDSDGYANTPATTEGPQPKIGAHDMVPGQEVRGFIVFKLGDGRNPAELQYQSFTGDAGVIRIR